MRNLWIRIGLGALFVFGAGMFFIAVGRQVKSKVRSVVHDGGSVSVPLSILPFTMDHNKVGSIRQLQVSRGPAPGAKRLHIRVDLKDGFAAETYANCLVRVDEPGPGGLFACVAEGSPEASGLVSIGEVEINPGGLTRPIVISEADAGDWANSKGGSLNLQSSGSGTVLQVTDENGRKVVQMQADSNGAYLKVRDENGREVVRLQAGSAGVQIDVKKDSAKKQ